MSNAVSRAESRMPAPEYTVITGTGRSGTTWLMRILDASPLTHCRSEPYGIASSPFNRLPQVWKSGASASDAAAHWEAIVSWSRGHVGERDYAFRHPKGYIHPLAQRSGLATLMAHRAGRRLLGLVQPRLRRGEWPLPWWMGSQRAMEAAYPVFKLNLDRRLIAWLLESRPEARILHIVRHPCGRLNSWLNRFAARREAQRIVAVNRERLRNIAAAEPEWRERFGDIDRMGLVESEVWFWRYVNESVYETARNHPAYLRVVYEELACDPLANARRLYEFCGLPWTGQIAAIITRELGESAWGKLPDSPASVAQAWRARLPQEHARSVGAILSGSPMLAWWPE